MIDFLISFDISTDGETKGLFIKEPLYKLAITSNDFDLFVWGDPIFSWDIDKELAKHSNWLKTIVYDIAGHYYFVLNDKREKKWMIGNSLFSILPIYYQYVKGKLLISNNPFSISGLSGTTTLNKRILLENILFGYPLFNQSCILDVQLLPSNNFIIVKDNSYSIEAHTKIESYFSDNPIPWKKSLIEIADVFIENSEKYFPDTPFITSLTGGFDGRTLTACALYFNKPISTYSFGSAESEDVKIASYLSSLLHVEYKNILLGQDYLQSDSLSCGLEFINNCFGTASFSRAHYLYAAKKFSKNASCLVTGNFGSEIFRAAHIAGAVISPNLYRLFNAKDFSEGINSLKNAVEWNFIKADYFKEERESLIFDLKKLPCFNVDFMSLPKNHQFYKFVFDEVFRKYFGAELQNQFQYIANRTPYLDWTFLKSILATGLAGVNSDFFTHNPLKRFKGQVLYGQIIKKTFPQLGEELTDKGYTPNNLLTLSGKFVIAKSYIQKKLVRSTNSVNDPYSVSSSFKVNGNYFLDNIDNEFFNTDFISESIKNGENRTALYIALSQSYYIKKRFKS